MGKFKIEMPAYIWSNEFVCLRSKMYAFKCGNDSKNKMKGVSKSQSKIINIQEYKKSLDREEYQRERDNYLIRSLNHEMYLRRVKKSNYLYSMINDVI